MWARFVNIMKYVWKNPIVQFACFTILEWAVVIFHKSTKNKFKKHKASEILDACSQDYSVGTSESNNEVEPEKKEVSAKVVKVEKQKKPRRTVKKKVVEKVEEPKPAKPKRTVKKKPSTTKTEEPVKKPRTRKKKTTAKVEDTDKK